MPKSINLKGTSGKSYNLDELQTQNTRNNPEEALTVQIWNWHPDLKGDHSKPNPPNPKIGQMWMSHLLMMTSMKDKEIFNKLKEGD